MNNSARRRNAELSLLLWVFLTISIGLWLVSAGKLATHPEAAAPTATVNINTADARTLARALGVPEAVGEALLTTRADRPGHAFSSVYELRHAKVLSGWTIAPDAGNRLVAREPDNIRRAVLLGGLATLLAFFLVHLVIRREAPGSDPILLPLVVLLAGVGLIAVFTVQDPLRDTFVFAAQASGVAFFGAAALLAPLTRPFKRLVLRRYRYAYAAGAILLILLLIVFGSGPGGVHLRLLGFEPVEVVKLLMVLFAVSYLADRRRLIADNLNPAPRPRDFAPLAAVFLAALTLFKVMNDLGPAVLLLGAFVTLVYLATGRRRYPAAGILLLVLAGIAGYRLHLGFFATRVTMWLSPWDNHDPRGGQLAEGLWGMSTGGPFGSGLGLGMPGVIPRAESDLVFATVGEELGLVGTTCLLLVYGLILARGYRIASTAPTEFDRLLAAGITTLLGIQTMMILGGVTGLLPLTGMTLPFVSFGSSSLVVDFFMVGLLLRLSDRADTADKVVDPPAAHWPRTLRAVTLGSLAYLALGIGIARLLPVQLLQDRQTALHTLLIPDRDGVRRPRLNPRLVAYAATIPRGRIEDRNGAVLAEDAPDTSALGVGLLTPDGRKRLYTGGPCIAHLLMAVEATPAVSSLGMNTSLRGYTDNAQLLASYRGRFLPGWTALHGHDVRVSIDLKLQRAAYDALVQAAQAIRDTRTGQPLDRGAAAVVDVDSGEALALVSSPSFDPAELTAAQWNLLTVDSRAPLLDRATAGLYPPGSTFKIVTAAAGLSHGLADTVVDCPHTIRNVIWHSFGVTYSRARVTDEEGMPEHGVTDMAKALRVSCNVYFGTLAVKMGATALHDTALGFNLKHIPTAEKIGEDLPDCGYGQGAIQVTPLEMASVVQAIADNGWQMPVRFLPLTASDLRSGRPGHRALPATDASTLQSMMLGVTRSGTAAGIFNSLPVSVAGKTGSAQNHQGDGRTHSWFVGFAPASTPRIAFACIVENGGQGRSAAAPACRDIVKAALIPN
ncbi:MAG: FtsW/RodA/SpoVE family cell cycle protein [Capsulimonadaceae bacterium]